MTCPSIPPILRLPLTCLFQKSERLQATHIPLFSEEELEEKKKAKRNSKKKNKKSSTVKERYNNWFGTRNDWSRKIQRVQGLRGWHFKQGNKGS